MNEGGEEKKNVRVTFCVKQNKHRMFHIKNEQFAKICRLEVALGTV